MTSAVPRHGLCKKQECFLFSCLAIGGSRASRRVQVCPGKKRKTR